MKLFSVISSVLLISALFLNTAAADPYRVQPIVPGVITIPPVPSYNYGYTAPTPPPAASYGYTAPAPVFNYTPPPNVIIPNEPIVIYRPPTGPSFYEQHREKMAQQAEQFQREHMRNLPATSRRQHMNLCAQIRGNAIGQQNCIDMAP